MKQKKIQSRDTRLGFTLMEVLLIVGIIALISGALIFKLYNTNKSTTTRQQVAYGILSNIRRAQGLALAGTNFNGQSVCGYGIHYLGPSQYSIYAGSVAGASDKCLVDRTNRNFNSLQNDGRVSTDFVVSTVTVNNSQMEIKGDFCVPRIVGESCDIFFESPGPKTYLDNTTLPTIKTSVITIGLVGSTCLASPCTTITVFSSGQINVSN